MGKGHFTCKLFSTSAPMQSDSAPAPGSRSGEQKRGRAGGERGPGAAQAVLKEPWQSTGAGLVRASCSSGSSACCSERSTQSWEWAREGFTPRVGSQLRVLHTLGTLLSQEVYAAGFILCVVFLLSAEPILHPPPTLRSCMSKIHPSHISLLHNQMWICTSIPEERAWSGSIHSHSPCSEHSAQ